MITVTILLITLSFMAANIFSLRAGARDIPHVIATVLR